VDVHVRRLRAKLGPEHEQLIGTVRNVGYKFVRPGRGGLGSSREPSVASSEPEPDFEDDAVDIGDAGNLADTDDTLDSGETGPGRATGGSGLDTMSYAPGHSMHTPDR
jgi:hypothetical protein